MRAASVLTIAVTTATFVAATTTFVVACASNEVTIPADDAGGEGPEAGGGGGGGDGGAKDAGKGDSAIPPSGTTCEITRAYVTACQGAAELTCGPEKFDAWCTQNDDTVNSAAFRRAESTCLTTANCNADVRRDCEYRTYATATPTKAQADVVAAYCATCEPADATCKTRKVSYDPAKGPKSTDSVFIAAWELSDAIADEIRTKCTGAAAPDAGSDLAACYKAFDTCAGDIYIGKLPDCP